MIVFFVTVPFTFYSLIIPQVVRLTLGISGVAGCSCCCSTFKKDSDLLKKEGWILFCCSARCSVPTFDSRCVRSGRDTVTVWTFHLDVLLDHAILVYSGWIRSLPHCHRTCTCCLFAARCHRAPHARIPHTLACAVYTTHLLLTQFVLHLATAWRFHTTCAIVYTDLVAQLCTPALHVPASWLRIAFAQAHCILDVPRFTTHAYCVIDARFGFLRIPPRWVLCVRFCLRYWLLRVSSPRTRLRALRCLRTIARTRRDSWFFAHFLPTGCVCARHAFCAPLHVLCATLVPRYSRA